MGVKAVLDIEPRYTGGGLYSCEGCRLDGVCDWQQVIQGMKTNDDIYYFNVPGADCKVRHPDTAPIGTCRGKDNMMKIGEYPDERTDNEAQGEWIREAYDVSQSAIPPSIIAARLIFQLRAHIKAQDARIAEVKQHNLKLVVELAEKSNPADQRLAELEKIVKEWDCNGNVKDEISAISERVQELEAKADRRWKKMRTLVQAYYDSCGRNTQVVLDAIAAIVKEGV
jgi:hypothetical protein